MRKIATTLYVFDNLKIEYKQDFKPGDHPIVSHIAIPQPIRALGGGLPKCDLHAFRWTGFLKQRPSQHAFPNPLNTGITWCLRDDDLVRVSLSPEDEVQLMSEAGYKLLPEKT